MEVAVNISRTTAEGASVSFSVAAPNKEAALEAAQFLLNGSLTNGGRTATAENKSASKGQEKKDQKPASAPADPSAASTTPTASDSSGNSSTASPATESSGQAASVTYDQVREVVLGISKTDKAKAEALLQRYGAVDKASGRPSAKVLKEDQWPAFIADGKRVLAGEYDPTATDGGEDMA